LASFIWLRINSRGGNFIIFIPHIFCELIYIYIYVYTPHPNVHIDFVPLPPLLGVAEV
jgi:hypothetical protein